MLIDTHCHFDFDPFVQDLSESIDKFQRAGISHIIVPAISKDRFSYIQTLASKHQSIYYALGLHPMYFHHQDDLYALEKAISLTDDKLVALGEIGLDRWIENADIERQQFFLTRQLDLAKQFHLPVILHSRQTHSLLYSALKTAKLEQRGVIHGFSGSYEEAMQFIRLGFYIGVGGVISYERAKKTRKAISQIPLSSIVLETDAPDMPLAGLQGFANRPENIVKIFDVFSSLRAEPREQLYHELLTNTLTLFPRINTIKKFD